jgi:O-antigen/teichoic acid export membrane protein
LHHAYSYKFITKFSPYFNWESFKPVFRYSLAIFAMGLFQMTATQSRPIILGIFSTQGVDILAEYRIIEVFPIFVISIGGMITSILLPKSSKFIHTNNTEKISKLAYQGTFITSIIVCFLTIPIIIVSKEILTLYVGVEYAFLSKWLIVGF